MRVVSFVLLLLVHIALTCHACTEMSTSNAAVPDGKFDVTQEMVAHFLEHGMVVIPNVLSAEEVKAAKAGMADTLREEGLDTSTTETLLQSKKSAWSNLGFRGGIVSVFYPHWKMNVALHRNGYEAYRKIFSASYGAGAKGHPSFQHPHGELSPEHVHAYLDRANYRMPDDTFLKVTGRPAETERLGQHLDSNPLEMYTYGIKNAHDFGRMRAKQRWRPIQTFIALTDVNGPNEGGFRCVKGFHKEFDQYFAKADRIVRCDPHSEFTALPPDQHEDIARRIVDIPCPAGSMVLWDWRIPHTNAPSNTANIARQVVYTGYLPDIPLNRFYAAHQLHAYRRRVCPPDFTQRVPDAELEAKYGSPFFAIPDACLTKEEEQTDASVFGNFDTALDHADAVLARRLMGIDPWSTDAVHDISTYCDGLKPQSQCTLS